MNDASNGSDISNHCDDNNSIDAPISRTASKKGCQQEPQQQKGSRIWATALLHRHRQQQKPSNSAVNSSIAVTTQRSWTLQQQCVLYTEGKPISAVKPGTAVTSAIAVTPAIAVTSKINDASNRRDAGRKAYDFCGDSKKSLKSDSA